MLSRERQAHHGAIFAWSDTKCIGLGISWFRNGDAPPRRHGTDRRVADILPWKASGGDAALPLSTPETCTVIVQVRYELFVRYQAGHDASIPGVYIVGWLSWCSLADG
jgi:hypothetical protein